MIDSFVMNGYVWQVIIVPAWSACLIDRNGIRTVATTDPNTLCVYLSSDLRGAFKRRVVAHEMGHACCFSYHLLDEIHDCCYPERWVDMEEWICNFVADYGEQIFDITYKIVGNKALQYMPTMYERMVA